MYLTYVDESGDTGTNPRSSRHLLLGAAVIFEGQWTYVKKDIDALLAKYFPTPPTPREIHCRDLRGGRNEFAKLPRAQRDAMLDEFCQLAANKLPVELRMFSVIMVPAFDREPLNSAFNAGKWHGVKYFGTDPVVQAAIRTCWA